MKRQSSRNSRWLYIAAALVLVLGCFGSAMLIIPALSSYPSLIAEAYHDQLQKAEIPGEADLYFERKGAYCIYYEGHEGAYIHAEWPPTLECSLTSESTGDVISLVPDYVPTNRYSTHDGRVGVLIYSTTIDEPGLHSLSCDYPDERVGPKLTLAIGPNYFYEFLHVVWILGADLLRGAGILCGSFVLSFGFAAIAFIRKATRG
ncbi:MAG: hypothetical protein PVI78_13200 [Anaerolineales bacterium]|jgi:hypothetical protein